MTSVNIPTTVTDIGNGAFQNCSSLAAVTIPTSMTQINEAVFQSCSSLAKVTIPTSVTSIGKSAFSGCSGLTSVDIPDSVSSIGWGAFSGCSGLTSVNVPAAMTSIGDGAFSGLSGLTSIEIPASVTSIGNSAFAYCSGLTSVVIPTSVTSIGGAAFAGCGGLTSVVIPSGVTSIGENAFGGCTGLTSVVIPTSVTNIGPWAFSWCYALASVTIPNSVSIIEEGTFSDCYSLATVTIPPGVTNIGPSAFYYCYSLVRVGLPDSVTSIENSAFAYCSGLTSVVIPTSVTSMEDNAFAGCSGLTSVVIREGLTSIGGGAFSGCGSLTNVDIPDSVTSIGNYAFEGCSSLTSVDISDSVTSIGDNAFDGCTGLTNVDLPNSLISIGNYAFSGCSGLAILDIPDSVTSIGDSALSGCSGLTSVKVPAAMTDIGGGAFSGLTGITSMVIPDSVTSIGDWAFSGCTGLTSVDFGSGLTSIGAYAFYGCTGLTSIDIPDNVTSIGWEAFSGCSELTSMVIGASVASANVVGMGFSNSGLTSVVIRAGVTSIGDNAFDGCTGLTNVDLPNSLISIGNYAFSGCSGLAILDIPDSVTSIGDSALSGCSGLTSVKVPAAMTDIGGGAFSGLTGITSMVIPDSVTSIGDWAFSGCTGLTSVDFGSGLTSIGAYAFYGCTGLTSIDIPDNVTSIGWEAFSGCSELTSMVIGASVASANVVGMGFSNSGLTSVVIRAGVTSIGDNAFDGCTGITNVDLPNSLISIGNYAFSGCSGLAILDIPDSVTSIGDSALSGCSGLTSVKVPAAMTDIGGGAFSGLTGITNMVIPDSVTSIGDWAFSGCTGLTSVDFGSGLTSIGAYAFYGCTGLTNVDIPDSVTSIWWEAFEGCSGLTSVEFGAGLTSIGDYAFVDCVSLAGVYFTSEPPELGYDVFVNVPGTAYYLSGTAGWGEEFGGLPTAVWGGPTTPTVPAAPTGLAASDGTATDAVSISWTAATGATGYKLYRGTSDNATAATLLSSPSGTTYTDSGASPGVLYTYWVAASNAAGDSAYSAPDAGFRALAAPLNVSASDNDTVAVTVSWSAVDGATHYRVSRASSASGTKTALGSWQTALSYADNTAEVGTTYTYWVSAAVDGNGTRASDYSAADTGARIAAALPAPTGLAASDGTATDAVSISWTAATGATGYKLYRGTSDNATAATLLSSPSGTSYTDSSASPGVLYTYWVAASNAAGDSAYSAPDTGYRKLAAPLNVAATDNDTAAVTVSWSAVTGATHYRVWRATSAGGTKTALGSWQSALSYSDNTAEVGTTYTYWVSAAVDSNGTRAGDYSAADTGVRIAAAPVAPTGLAASDGTSLDAVSLSWTASAGATGYKLYRGTSDNAATATLLSSPSGTSYTDSSASPGVMYTYWVAASNAAGDSAYSAADTGYRKLAAPLNVAATDNDTVAVTVSWSAVDGATHYRVWRATSASGTKTALGSWQSALSYADTTAEVGTTYTYWVSAAVDGNGTRASDYSAPDTGVRIAATLPAPTGLAASDGTATDAVSLSWTASAGATGYKLYRGTSDNSSAATLLSSPSGTTYTDSGASPGVMYTYWVAASNAAGDSAYSAADAGFRALAAPLNVAATDNDSTAVTVSWSAVDGATHYRVWRATSASGTKTALGSWQSALSYADTTAEVGTTYTYWVSAAVDGNGTRASDYSAPDTGVRIAATLPAPTGLAASDGTATDAVSLSWTASAGATGYKLYRGTSDNSSAATLLSSPSGTTYTDSSASPGVMYTYWVAASNAAGDSAYSAADAGFRALAAPLNVAATDNDSTAVTVSWSAVDGATHYRVWRATSAGGTKTALGSWQSALSYADNTAEVGTTYTYWVSAAVDGNGTRASDYSAPDTGVRIDVASPWGDPVNYMNVPMTIIADVLIGNGEVVAAGSVVAVFVGEELRGKETVLSFEGRFSVNLTVQVNADNEVLTFKLWLADTKEIMDSATTVSAKIAGEQGTVDDPVILSFGSVTQTVSLLAGWNHISFFVGFADDSPAAVFAPVMDKLKKIISDNKNYVPGYGALNTLKQMRPGLGHWVNMSAAAELTVTGMPLNAAATPITLKKGWNNVGYILSSPSAVAGALAGILPQVEKVIGENKNYSPALGPLNTLKQLNPGRGYWIRVNADTTLIYQEAVATRAASAKTRGGEQVPAMPWGEPVIYQNVQMTILGELRLEGESTIIPEGSVVGVFAGQELRGCETVVPFEERIFVNLTVNVATTGEELTFKLWLAGTELVHDSSTKIPAQIGGEVGTLESPQILVFGATLYKVTFVLGDYGVRTGGGALQQNVEAGGGAIAPEVSPIVGWQFTGWDQSFSQVDNDVTITAQYEAVPISVMPWGEPVIYQNVQMTILGELRLEGESTIVPEGSVVGVFAGQELRGCETVVPFDEQIFVNLTVNVATTGEELTFKLWLAGTELVHDSSTKIPAQIGGEVGTLESPQILVFGATQPAVSLLAGWNMISVPLNLTVESQESLLSYSPFTLDGDLGSYILANSVLPGKAYWIFAASPDYLPLAGDVPQNGNLELGDGWNFVGVVEETFLPAAEYIVWEWALGSYRPPVVINNEICLEVGKGYWIMPR
ncbi:fibronectin type 3 domain-containing protein [Oligosphaera ethanolica]|uniref:Fibronectin type 3 domain-containing protein n=2 Tax=Oligosphaera ethanolica TaxID=760260 RepID=A0AAE3VDK4_9BACT|nr:leucine-rich repeat protein [Oligosphaera ethanolica]MDQ0288539.1 fibronectin type 3 domain-containing protein [Oligosphaera ethanolica]